MTRKIGVSLPDDLYEWATAAVAEGRAESVSALVAEGLELLEARAHLEWIVADLRTDVTVDEATREWMDNALAAADRAQRGSAGKVA
jgi:Arc/MetJ-type ribon-helix-helix transcriptional regulator